MSAGADWLVRSGWRHAAPSTKAAILTLAAIVLITGYVASLNPISVLGTSLPFGFRVAWFRPRWLSATVGLGTVAVSAVVVAVLSPADFSTRDVIMMGVFFGAAVTGFAGSSIGWQMQRRVDQHHADQNELSPARQRLQFAADLHDIQGHTLLAIKMKAELANLDRRFRDRGGRFLWQHHGDRFTVTGTTGEHR